MTSAKSKGSQKNLYDHPLPDDKIIFWDTNFVISALFPSFKERYENLCSKATHTPLSIAELEERQNLAYLFKRHQASAAFIERLIQSEMNVAFSSILFTEVYFGIKYIELETVYGSREQAKKELGDDPKILTQHIPAILRNWNLFLELLGKFPGRIFAINPTEAVIVTEVLRLRIQYGLTPNDSFHLATSITSGCKDIVAFDRALTNVGIDEGLNVWCTFFQKKDPGVARTPGLGNRPE